MEEEPLEELRQFLMKLPAGWVSPVEQPKLVELLQDCWHIFRGSAETRMAAGKLGRMKDPEWHPPSLAFEIERHGSAGLGSTRAERQIWYVDLDSLQAECQIIGWRQLYPRDAVFDVKPVADELSNLIICGSKDERLQWSAAGRVRILTGRILSARSKQTLEGRRKRFLKAMEERLAPHGWRRRGSWWQRKDWEEEPVNSQL